jgi:DNA polymerase-3 subunit beta
MKFTISQPDFASALAKGGASVTKGLGTIMSHVRLVVTGDCLEVASTNGDTFAETVTPVENASAGRLTVSFSALASLIGRYPKTGVVMAALEGPNLIVKCGRSKVKLATLSADSFPVWDQADPVATFEIAGSDLARILGRTRPAAVPAGGSWPFLQGVNLHVRDDFLRAVATDRHVLAMATAPLPPAAAAMPSITIPNDAVDTIAKSFKESPVVTVSVGKVIRFGDADMVFASKLIEGAYPDPDRLLPARGGAPMTFDRRQALDSLGRAMLWTGEGIFSDCTARPDDGSIRITTRNASGDEGDEGFEAEIGAGYRAFRFNPPVLTRLLSGFTDERITVEQTAPDKPFLVYADSPEFIGLFMPVRGQA